MGAITRLTKQRKHLFSHNPADLACARYLNVLGSQKKLQEHIRMDPPCQIVKGYTRGRVMDKAAWQEAQKEFVSQGPTTNGENRKMIPNFFFPSAFAPTPYKCSADAICAAEMWSKTRIASCRAEGLAILFQTLSSQRGIFSTRNYWSKDQAAPADRSSSIRSQDAGELHHPKARDVQALLRHIQSIRARICQNYSPEYVNDAKQPRWAFAAWLRS